jgi:hypothetical protein
VYVIFIFVFGDIAMKQPGLSTRRGPTGDSGQAGYIRYNARLTVLCLSAQRESP